MNNLNKFILLIFLAKYHVAYAEIANQPCHLLEVGESWVQVEEVPENLKVFERSSLINRQYIWYKNKNNTFLVCAISKNPSNCSGEESSQFQLENGLWKFKKGSYHIILCVGA